MRRVKKQIDFEEVLAKAPEPKATSVDGFVKFLTENTRRDSQKARLTYMWIARNIEYDVSKFYFSQRKAEPLEEIMASGKTTCRGYADLFTGILQKFGIDVQTISGIAKGLLHDPEIAQRVSNHDWNVIKLDGEWNIVDVAWGAGSINGKNFIKEYDEFYYCAEPELIIQTHFPEDPKWQLLDTPISREHFDQALKCKALFYNIGFTEALPNKAILESTNGQIQIKLGLDTQMASLPLIQVVLRQVAGEQAIEMNQNIFAERRESSYTIDCWLPENGKYHLIIYAPKKSGEKTLHEILVYKIYVKGLEKPLEPKLGVYPEQFIRFHDLRGHIISPRTGILHFGEKYKFSIEATGAENIVVLCGENWNPLNKEKDSNIYSEEVEIDEKNVGVFAKIPEGKGFECILKYRVEESKESKIESPVKKDLGIIKKCGLLNFPKEGVLEVKKNRLHLEMDADPKCVLIGSLNTEDKKEVEEAVFIQKQGSHYEIEVGFPDNGMYKLLFFAKLEGDTGSLPLALQYSIQASEIEKLPIKFPNLFAGFKANEAYLFEPLSGELKAGSKQNFKIKLPKASSALILLGKVEVSLVEEKEKVFSTPTPIEIPESGTVGIYALGGPGQDANSMRCMVEFSIGS